MSALRSNQNADGDIRDKLPVPDINLKKVWRTPLLVSCWSGPFVTYHTMASPAFDDIEKGGGALRTIKDLAAGAAGGMAQVLLGMWACGLRGRRIN